MMEINVRSRIRAAPINSFLHIKYQYIQIMKNGIYFELII